MMNPIANDAYYQSLQQLQSIDFALVELNLYLDTHPEDNQAIQQFNELRAQRDTMAKAFEGQFGPLMNYGATTSSELWNRGPWPWQV
ncbi:spore coat protein CotJB [Alicyclobacillus acidoterrestris]|nr:spore coat protein CotJB [Alicyclobacillus acidoterrestris]